MGQRTRRGRKRVTENKPIQKYFVTVYHHGIVCRGLVMKEHVLVTRDGKKLVCTVWENATKPVGVVQIIHGIGEHPRRYDRLAKYLNRHGYIVFGDEHRAFELDSTGDKNTDLFDITVDDELEITEYLKNKYSLPVLLFGHGYGSFITQAIMERTDLCTAGVCLANSARYPEWLLAFARAIAWTGEKLWGANAPARFIEFFAPMSRNFDSERQNNRRTALSYGFYFSLFKNLMKLTGNACPLTPLLIISGSQDLITMNSRLSLSLYREYQAHGMQNLTFIIYPAARHELLLDANYKDVQRDILEFFDSIIYQN